MQRYKQLTTQLLIIILSLGNFCFFLPINERWAASACIYNFSVHLQTNIHSDLICNNRNVDILLLGPA